MGSKLSPYSVVNSSGKSDILKKVKNLFNKIIVEIII